MVAEVHSIEKKGTTMHTIVTTDTRDGMRDVRCTEHRWHVSGPQSEQVELARAVVAHVGVTLPGTVYDLAAERVVRRPDGDDATAWSDHVLDAAIADGYGDG